MELEPSSQGGVVRSPTSSIDTQNKYSVHSAHFYILNKTLTLMTVFSCCCVLYRTGLCETLEKFQNKNETKQWPQTVFETKVLISNWLQNPELKRAYYAFLAHRNFRREFWNFSSFFYKTQPRNANETVREN